MERKMAARVIACLNCLHWNYQHYNTGECNVCDCKQLKIHPWHEKCEVCGRYADEHDESE